MAPDTPHPQITYFEELKRKGIHLSSLWMVVAIILIPDWRITAAIFAVLLVITLLFEHAYACNWPVMAPMYGFFFRKMLRKPPAPGAWIVSGGAYVLAAALLVVILYAPLAAARSSRRDADRRRRRRSGRPPVRTPQGPEQQKL